MGDARCKIFIVDDSKTVLEFVSLCLQDAGHDVMTFENPLSITREAMRQNPDVILVDVSMPALNGDKLIPIIRDLKGNRNGKIVLYSSRTEQELMLLARSCGADGYITKSMDPEQFLNSVERYLASRPLV